MNFGINNDNIFLDGFIIILAEILYIRKEFGFIMVYRISWNFDYYRLYLNITIRCLDFSLYFGMMGVFLNKY